MKAYILSIAGVVILSAVVAIICPNGKMGTFVKGCTRLFVLVVMISPLVGWIRTGKPALETGELEEDPAYLAACAHLLEERDEAAIAAYLSDEFSLSAEVDATRAASAYFPLEKIKVKLDLSGINEEEARIYIMTRVKEALETQYGTEAEVT